MTDATGPAPRTPRTNKDEVVEDAVIVEETETVTETPDVIEVETVHATDNEPIVATTDPASTQTSTPAQQVIYVQVPAAPARLGNRGFGALIALASAVVYTAVLAALTILLRFALTGSADASFLGRAEFYIPTLFFVIGFVILVLIANRANWGAYIVGSLIVALVVYFGTIGLGLLGSGIITNTPDEAAGRFAASLRDPFIIGAALLAREVTMWTGILISRRGRRLKVRNAEARDAYDRELAEKRAGYDTASAV
jgi:hypothetical protein